jgi:proteasome accessory factor B
LGESAVVERRPDGSVSVRLPVVNRSAFRTWVLDLLDHAEVLGPDELRDDLVAWLEAMARGAS